MGLVPALFLIGSLDGRFRLRIPRDPFRRRQDPLCCKSLERVLDSCPTACLAVSKRCPDELLVVAHGACVLALVSPRARPRTLAGHRVPQRATPSAGTLLEIPKRLVMAFVLGGVVVAFLVVVAVVPVVVVVMSQIPEWVLVRKKGLAPRKLEKQPPPFCPEGVCLQADLLLPVSQC